MQYIKLFFRGIILVSFAVSWAVAADKHFDSEQMLSDLESKLKLTAEQLADLKPAIDAKSVEMKKSMHEFVDKGFVQLDLLSEKLGKVSKDTEKQAEEFLGSEDMEKLKEYLSKIDEKAIEEMKNKVVTEFSAVLDLTVAQMKKLKPVLEESVTELADIFAELAEEGNRNWASVKQQYEQFSEELKEKLQDTLDKKQMEKLKKYNEENKVKVQQVLYSA